MGVKLSEAQSYLVKSSDYVHMVVCDGFNVTQNSIPFPRLNATASSSIPNYDLNETPQFMPKSVVQPLNGHLPGDRIDYGGQQMNGQRTKAPIPTPQSAQCNYDNLRDIDTDDYLHSTNLSNNITNNNNTTTTTNNNGNTNNGSNNINGTKASTPQQHSSSLPITDKSLMNNIMSKSGGDPKSQSMFANTNNTPNVASVRIFNKVNE